jgi:hypothetical protein
VEGEGGEEQPTDELIGSVVEAVRPHRADDHVETWRLLVAHHDQIRAWLKEGLRVVKCHDLLTRRGVIVPERTVHRYVLEAFDHHQGRGPRKWGGALPMRLAVGPRKRSLVESAGQEHQNGTSLIRTNQARDKRKTAESTERIVAGGPPAWAGSRGHTAKSKPTVAATLGKATLPSRTVSPLPRSETQYQRRECLRRKPASAFASGNRWRCLDCGGQERAPTSKGGVRVVVSGGLPGLGRRGGSK